MGRNSKKYHQKQQQARKQRMSNKNKNQVAHLPGTVGAAATDGTPKYSGPISESYSGVALRPRHAQKPDPFVTDLNKFRKMIVFSKMAYDKMNFLIGHCDKEIGWLGSVTEHDNIYYVSDIYLFNQEVSGGETDIDAAALGDFYEQVIDRLGPEEGNKFLSTIRLWGHSHVRMGIGPSKTDEDTVKELFQDQMDFFIRIIGNKHGEMKADLYRNFHCQELEKPMRFEWVDAAWDVAYVQQEPVPGIFEEMKSKVKEKTYRVSTPANPYYQGPGYVHGAVQEQSKKNGRVENSNQTTGTTNEITSPKKNGTTDAGDSAMVVTVEPLKNWQEIWWTHMTSIGEFYDRFFDGHRIASVNDVK